MSHSLKLEGFTEAKRRVVDAIDFRLTQLRDKKACLKQAEDEGRREMTHAARMNDAEDEGRADELESLRCFVKGMATRVE